MYDTTGFEDRNIIDSFDDYDYNFNNELISILNCHNIPTYEKEYVTVTDGIRQKNVVLRTVDPDENKLSIINVSVCYLNNKARIELTISNGFDIRYKYLYFDDNKFEYSTYLDLKANVNIKAYLYFNLIGSDKQKMVVITNQILNKIYDDTSSDKFLLKLDKNTIFGSTAQISNYNEFGYDIIDETNYIDDIEDKNIKDFITKPIKIK